MDDSQLVQRMRSGDERAFDEFFGAYFPRLFHFAVRRLGNEDAAEDVVQAALIKTLGACLDWVSHEGAWTVTFADRRFSEAARATVLHGRPDLLKGLTPAEALDVVLPACGLRHRIDGHEVVIARETSAGAIQ